MFLVFALAVAGLLLAPGPISLLQPALAYSGSTWASKSAYSGEESVTVYCSYSAYYSSRAVGQPTASCYVDSLSFLTGWSTSGSGSQSYATIQLGPGTHRLTVYYATGVYRVASGYYEYIYSSTTASFSIGCPELTAVTTTPPPTGAEAYLWSVYNRDANQDCGIDSVVITWDQATPFGCQFGLNDTSRCSTSDQPSDPLHPLRFKIEFQGYETDGSVHYSVGAAIIPPKYLVLRTAPNNRVFTGTDLKQMKVYMTWTKPYGSTVTGSNGVTYTLRGNESLQVNWVGLWVNPSSTALLTDITSVPYVYNHPYQYDSTQFHLVERNSLANYQGWVYFPSRDGLTAPSGSEPGYVAKYWVQDPAGSWSEMPYWSPGWGFDTSSA